jgi:hypothetical protein
MSLKIGSAGRLKSLDNILNKYIKTLKLIGSIFTAIIALLFAVSAAVMVYQLFIYPADSSFAQFKIEALIGALFAFGFALVLSGSVWALFTVSPRYRVAATSVILFGISNIILSFVIKTSIDRLSLGLELSKSWFLLPFGLWAYSVYYASKTISHKKDDSEQDNHADN